MQKHSKKLKIKDCSEINAKVKIKRKMAAPPSTLPGQRYNSLENQAKLSKEAKYMGSHTKSSLINREAEIQKTVPRTRSEVRMSDARKFTPNSTKNTSLGRQADKVNLNIVKSLGNIYFQKKRKTIEDESPQFNSKLAATLDPRQFNSNDPLLGQTGPLSINFKPKSAGKRAISNGQSALLQSQDRRLKLNTLLLQDENQSPRHEPMIVTQSLNSNLLDKENTPNDNIYFEMDIRKKNSSVPRAPISTFKQFSSIRSSQVSQPTELTDQIKLETPNSLPLKLSSQLYALEGSNHKMRNSFSSLTLTMNSVMASCLKLRKANDPSKKQSLDTQLKEISNNVDQLNSEINNLQYYLLSSDDSVRNIQVTAQEISLLCKDLSNHDPQVLTKLQQQNQSLSQEIKYLKSSIKKTEQSTKDQRHMSNYTIESLEKLLSEQKNENKNLVSKIEDLQIKVDQSEAAVKSELKWISKTEKIMEQSSKFLVAMKKLQNVVRLNKNNDKMEADPIQTPKQQFELHKKLLEQVIKETKLQLANASYDPPKKEDQDYLNYHIQFYEEQIKAMKHKIEELTNKNKITVGTQTCETTESLTHLSAFNETGQSITRLKCNVKELESAKEQLHHQLKTQETAIKNLKEQNKTLTTQMELVQQSANESVGFSAQIEIEKHKMLTQQALNDVEKVKMEYQLKELELTSQLKDYKQKLMIQIKEAQDKSIVQQESDYKLTKVQDQLKKRMDEIAQLTQNQEDQERQLKDFKAALTESQDQKSALEEELRVKKQKLKDMQEHLQELQKEFNEVNSKLNGYISKEQLYETEIKSLKHQLTSSSDKTKESERKLQDLQSQLDEKTHAITLLTFQSQEYEKKVKDRDQSEKRMKEEFDRLKKNTISVEEMSQAKALLQQKYDELLAKHKSVQLEFEKEKQINLTRVKEFKLPSAQEDPQVANLKAQIEELKLQHEQKETQIHQIQTQSEAKHQKLEQENKDLVGQMSQLHEELNEAEQVRGKHQQTLEKNRDLITLLKEQLQKTVEKSKQIQESNANMEVHNQKVDLLHSEISKHKKELEKAHQQNDTLKSQVSQLKLQFQEKMVMLSNQIDELQQDKIKQENLIADANSAIEELTLEKHDIAAKFKHLIQVYVHNATESQYQSSYKGDESSLSIGNCFEQVQQALEQKHQKLSQKFDDSLLAHKIQIEGSPNIMIKEDIDAGLINLPEPGEFSNEEPLPVADVTNETLNEALEEMHHQTSLTNAQLKDFLNQLRKARSKIDNYKQKLGEKSKQIKGLKATVKKMESDFQVLNQDKQNLDQNLQSIKNSGHKNESQVLELNSRNIQLKAKLDYKETQIKDLEKQLAALKVELEAANKKVTEATQNQKVAQSNHSKSELVDQLEMENMELLDKLTQTEKEIQELRKARDAPVDQNNLMDADALQKFEELSTKLKELTQQLELAKSEVTSQILEQFDQQVAQVLEEIIPNVLSQGEQLIVNYNLKPLKTLKIEGWTVVAVEDIKKGTVLFLNQDNLTSNELQMLSRFNPGYFNTNELPQHAIHIDQNLDRQEVPNEHMDAFQTQIRDIRAEQKELTKELAELRAQVEDNIDFDLSKDLQTLRDDVQFFTAENLELRLKIKALVMQNMEQKHRITQLLQEGRSVNVPRDSQDNFELSPITNNSPQDRKIMNNLPSAIPQNQHLIKEEGEPSMISLDKLKFFNESTIDHKQQPEIRLSDIDLIDAENELQSLSNVGDNHTPNNMGSSQNINVSNLEQQLKEANTKIANLVMDLNLLKQAAVQQTQNIVGNASKIQQSNLDQQQQLDQSTISNESYKNILQHVKGTLIMYLKKTPIVDAQNECLLQIIFSMMNFEQREIIDLKDAREDLPVYVIDVSKRQMETLATFTMQFQ